MDTEIEKYCPSNGTEGSDFMEKFCFRCVKDKDAEADGGCPIVLAAMIYSIDEEEYPKEWIYDKEGHPVCTVFEQIE